MKTTQFIGSVIAFGVLLAAPAMFAQAGRAELPAQEWLERPGGVFSEPPVVGAPFSAEAVTTWQPGANSGRPAMRATARYHRDRSGRVRVEQYFVGHDGSPQRVIITPDAGRRLAYLLDPVARTLTKATRMTGDMMVGGSGDQGHFILPVSANRVLSFHERADERRVSQDLKVVEYLRSEDAEGGVVEYQLLGISRADQPARLFELPRGYAELPRLPMTWENPFLQRPKR